MRYKSTRKRRASDVRRVDGATDASTRAERARAGGSTTASSTQAIKMFTYFNNGVPLLVVDEEPRFGEYPDHKHVVFETTKRRSTRVGGGGGGEDPSYHLYSQYERRWGLVVGIKDTQPKTSLNLNKLMACARHPDNEWGIIDQGTLEQMNERAPQQLEELWKACGASPTSLLSMERANSIVNGASTCVRIFCPFPTQVKVALNTTLADDSPLAFCRLWPRILLAKLQRKGSCGWLVDLTSPTPLRRVPIMMVLA